MYEKILLYYIICDDILAVNHEDDTIVSLAIHTHWTG